VETTESYQIRCSRKLFAVADAFENAIADTTDASLRHRPAEGAWSAIEVIGHMIDKMQAWGQRVERIATEDRPFLPGFDQDAYVHERGYQRADATPLLAALRDVCERFASIVENTPDDALDRNGVHGEFGPISARTCIDWALGSVPDHLQQVRAALAHDLQ
jgi:DinB superfamily